MSIQIIRSKPRLRPMPKREDEIVISGCATLTDEEVNTALENLYKNMEADRLHHNEAMARSLEAAKQFRCG